MSKTFSVVFHGFHSIEEAQVFADWYSGQGEQDAAYWMDCNSDCDSVNEDMSKYKYPREVIDNTVQVHLDVRIKNED